MCGVWGVGLGFGVCAGVRGRRVKAGKPAPHYPWPKGDEGGRNGKVGVEGDRRRELVSTLCSHIVAPRKQCPHR